MNNGKWCIINVVWYDGVEAYVSHFIGQANDNLQATKRTKERITKYLDGNGEILKFDVIKYLGLSDVIDYKDKGDSDSQVIWNRFLEVWGC